MNAKEIALDESVAGRVRREALELFGLSESDRVDADTADRVRTYVVARIKELQRRAYRAPKSLGMVAATRAMEVIGIGESPIERVMMHALIMEEKVRDLLRIIPVEIGPYRTDLAVPELKLDIECDGRDYHTSPAQIAKDQRRDAYLARLGWTVVRFTGSQIKRDTAACVRAVVRIIGVLGAAAEPRKA